MTAPLSEHLAARVHQLEARNRQLAQQNRRLRNQTVLWRQRALSTPSLRSQIRGLQARLLAVTGGA